MSSLLELDYMIRNQIETAKNNGLDNVIISFPPITHPERVIMSGLQLQTTDIWKGLDCHCNDHSLHAWCICRAEHVGVKVSWNKG